MNLLTFTVMWLLSTNTAMATPLVSPFQNVDLPNDKCPRTKIDNRTNEWTNEDIINLGYAKRRCAELYPDAPCCKVFIKKEIRNYSVVCGAP